MQFSLLWTAGKKSINLKNQNKILSFQLILIIKQFSALNNENIKRDISKV